MSNDISKFKELHKALRESANKFCDLAELNEQTTDPHEVEKVRRLIEATAESLDETPIIVDVISAKAFLALKKAD